LSLRARGGAARVLDLFNRRRSTRAWDRSSSVANHRSRNPSGRRGHCYVGP